MNKLKKIDEIRHKLKSQKISIGSWMQIDDENVAEIIGGGTGAGIVIFFIVKFFVTEMGELNNV